MLKKLKQIVKKYGLFRFESEKLFQLNRELKRFNKMQKKYAKNLTQKYEMPSNPQKSNKVWFCWLQGIENAPEVAQACYKSIVKNLKGKEIIVITKENLSTYVTMPDYILEKWEKKIISNTHMSDLIRMQLLITHGGTWIDSSCLCTGNIPKHIEDANFFVFRNEFRNEDSCDLSSWFISSIANHPILLHTRDLIFEYWKNENKLADYFLFHFFVSMCMRVYNNLLDDAMFISTINPHTLQFMYIFKKFTPEIYTHVKGLSFIHKLSNKFDLSKIDISNTFYEELIRKNNF